MVAFRYTLTKVCFQEFYWVRVKIDMVTGWYFDVVKSRDRPLHELAQANVSDTLWCLKTRMS